MKHANVAIFVPHEGCPHRCSFCNQRDISGSVKRVVANDVKHAIKIACDSLGQDTKKAEIAFFGGSFTAIDRRYRNELLAAAAPFVRSGRFAGIRISTRPDYIDREILNELKEYNVTSIELGAQSMDDHVLAMNDRGHTAQDVINAAELIKEHGFSLGLQMMVGLYGDSREKVEKTALQLAALQPETVRIYPTLVMKGTHLERLFLQGKYKPLTLKQAVDICSRLLYMFFQKNIKVIRLGLHAGSSLENGLVAGPYHPAFRELCESRIYFDKALDAIANLRDKPGNIDLYVAPFAISKMKGQKRQNIKELSKLGYNCTVKSDNYLSLFEVKATLSENNKSGNEVRKCC